MIYHYELNDSFARCAQINARAVYRNGIRQPLVNREFLRSWRRLSSMTGCADCCAGAVSNVPPAGCVNTEVFDATEVKKSSVVLLCSSGHLRANHRPIT